jgi:hypothetical protein
MSAPAPAPASFEAVALCRPAGSRQPYEQKWLTVPTCDLNSATNAFAERGYEVKALRVLAQADATTLAERIARSLSAKHS